MFKKNLLLLLFLYLLGCQSVWSQNVSSIIEATGDQVYCPLTQIPIATDFKILNSNFGDITQLFIQISTGYVIHRDQLLLTGSHPKIKTSWNTSEGKLTLSSVGGISITRNELIEAVLDVVFQSDDKNSSGERFFSFSIGNANYLPSTGHYYEFVSSVGITWHQAKIAASERTYYGLQGYLATIGSPEESQLAGEQSAGAGWIGGTDEEVEGVWKWATGPEAGTIFWNGGPNGSAPAGRFSNWNTGEPNNLEDEDYVHITAPGVGPKGAWNDLSNTGGQSGDYQPKGYIVEYGGMPGDPEINISASTKIRVNPIFHSLKLPDVLPDMEVCDSDDDGDDTNGFATFDLTAYKSLLITGTSASEYQLQFYTDSEFSNLIANPTHFNNTEHEEQRIYIRIHNIMDATCFIEKSFLIKVVVLPIVPLSIIYKNCDVDGVNDGFTEFNLREIDINFNAAQSPGLKISYHQKLEQAQKNEDDLSAAPFNNATAATIYARTENSNGCYVVSTVHLKVSTTSFPTSYFKELILCDDDGVNDGIHLFDLEAIKDEFIAQFPSNQNLKVTYYEDLSDAQLSQNEITNTHHYSNNTSDAQVLFVRVESEDNGDCFGIGPHLKLTVNPLPEFTVSQSEGLCVNGGPVDLQAQGINGNHSYTWKNASGEIISTSSSATIDQPGVYTIMATSVFGCDSQLLSYNIKASSIANLTDESIVINDLNAHNSITVDTSSLGIGAYEFALDSPYGPYQDHPVFLNVAHGRHILYVKDKNGCGTAELKIYVMGFPKYFTPNNDGFNDTWNIQGFTSQFSSQSYIDIFDRYGAFIARIHPGDTGWDGTFKGKPMTATDYWYVGHFIDALGSVKNYQGHFSLIR